MANIKSKEIEPMLISCHQSQNVLTCNAPVSNFSNLSNCLTKTRNETKISLINSENSSLDEEFFEVNSKNQNVESHLGNSVSSDRYEIQLTPKILPIPYLQRNESNLFINKSRNPSSSSHTGVCNSLNNSFAFKNGNLPFQNLNISLSKPTFI